VQSSRLNDQASPFHYAAGDVVASKGIKRCGAAMSMGQIVASNIVQHILHVQQRKFPVWTEWPEMPPMIALAIGDSAAAYDPNGGLKTGKDQKELYFGDDFGLTCKSAVMDNRLRFLTSRRLRQRNEAG
jgi:hypothetical protein